MLNMKIRKYLYECCFYSKLLPKSKLYISISLFWLGLINYKVKWTKELLRIFLKYKFHSDTKLIELINYKNQYLEGILKRIFKCSKNKLEEN